MWQRVRHRVLPQEEATRAATTARALEVLLPTREKTWEKTTWTEERRGAPFSNSASLANAKRWYKQASKTFLLDGSFDLDEVLPCSDSLYAEFISLG